MPYKAEKNRFVVILWYAFDLSEIPKKVRPFINFIVTEILKILKIKICRSSHPEVFLEKGVLEICSKFTWEHPCQSVISIKLQLYCSFIEIALWYGWSPVNLLHIFRTPFPRELLWTAASGSGLSALNHVV